MPYLIQLHCDARMQDGSPAMEANTSCLSSHCVQPTAMCEDANKALLSVREEARGNGWSFIGQRWLCPACAEEDRKIVRSDRGGYRRPTPSASLPVQGSAL